MAAKKKTTAKKDSKKEEAKKAPAKKKAAAKKAPAKKTAAKKAPAKKKAAKPSLSPEERYARIQLEAYYLAEKNGFQGDASGYWAEAESIVNAQYS